MIDVIQTTDAQVWAEEWCRIAREIEAADDGRQVIDEGWMITWFANAIETGRAASAYWDFPSDEDVEVAADAWKEARQSPIVNLAAARAALQAVADARRTEEEYRYQSPEVIDAGGGSAKLQSDAISGRLTDPPAEETH